MADEAQIRRLDAWTREAIDERLKTLEDVQRTLWKCTEDLERMRSALPPLYPPTTTAEPMADVKDKGKARAMHEHEASIPEESSPLNEWASEGGVLGLGLGPEQH